VRTRMETRGCLSRCKVCRIRGRLARTLGDVAFTYRGYLGPGALRHRGWLACHDRLTIVMDAQWQGAKHIRRCRGADVGRYRAC
jgi:hypothetical protein